jgi:hypothetical protein
LDVTHKSFPDISHLFSLGSNYLLQNFAPMGPMSSLFPENEERETTFHVHINMEK